MSWLNMKFKTCFRRMNGSIVMMRRFGFVWWKYLPYENLENAKVQEMNQHAQALMKAHDEYRQLQREKSKANKDIDDARDAPEGYSYPKVRTLPVFPFKHKRTDKPAGIWERFAHVLRSGKASFAETVASERGNAVNPDQPDGLEGRTEVINSQTISPQRGGGNQNQNQKQKGNQQQQGQRNTW